jgi:glutathione S-transferase
MAESNCNLITYGVVGLVAFVVLKKIVPLIQKHRMLNRWKKTPKNTVIFHGIPRGRTVPMGSPFVLKLETYLKVANIAYKLDVNDPFGPTGKTPWISYNGEHVGDSHMCIQYLNKKFEKNLNGKHSEDKLALAHAVRIILEEHVFFGIRLWAFLGEGRASFGDFFKAPWIQMKLLLWGYGRTIKEQTWAQGLSRHSDEEIERMMKNDLRAVSKILGNNKYIIGDEVCEDDCAIFGMLALFVWGHASVSPYGKFVKDELPNIIGYCERVKAKFWPDWNFCLNP